jgi:hypothetical protein
MACISAYEVGDSGWVIVECADDVDQSGQQLRHCPVKLGQRPRDVAGSESGVDLAEPGLEDVHIVVREPEGGSDIIRLFAPVFLQCFP